MLKKGIFFTLIGVMLSILASWAGVVIMTYLISLCFDFTFTLKIGTGVWLTLLMLNLSLKISTKGGK